MSEKTFIIDAHVHIYEQFYLRRAIQASLDNFSHLVHSVSPDDLVRYWLLTERSDCSFFRTAVQREDTRLGSFAIRQADDHSLYVYDNEKERLLLYIIAGRQIVSREGLEVCCIGVDLSLDDRTYNSTEIISIIKENGGVPVLNWAPGKWFSSRGRVVRDLIDHADPGDLLIGDTSMRPTFWPTPKLMSEGVQKGLKRIAGSDPLPFSGEERLIGSYGFAAEAAFDPDNPAASCLSLLNNPDIPLSIVGHRSRPLPFLRRQIKIMREKQRRRS